MRFSSTENANVVNVVQAMIGSVSPNFRRVCLSVGDDGGVSLWFLLEHEDEDDRWEIEEIAFAFSALQQPGAALHVAVVVDDRPLDGIVLPGRVVYGRREVATARSEEARAQDCASADSPSR